MVINRYLNYYSSEKEKKIENEIIQSTQKSSSEGASESLTQKFIH